METRKFKLWLSVTALSSVALVAACTQSDGQQLAEAPPPPPEMKKPSPPPPPPPPPAPMAERADLAISAKRIANPGIMPPRPIYPGPQANTEEYEGEEVSPIKLVQTDPVSTFSVDVDTGAYANARRFISDGRLPPKDAVRTEELINYFRYDYPRPTSREVPFSVTTDLARSPWNDDTRLMRIGLRGYDIDRDERPAANLVFLVDVSGSMRSPDKLPLVKTALSNLAGELTSRDKVSIVVYSGRVAIALEPTNDKAKIRRALQRLEAGGSTAGGAGMKMAYDLAREHFIESGVNRVIMATDGDFNVGVSDNKQLIDMIEKKRDSGITLTTLGFGTGNYNEALMERVADHGNGNYAYIDSALEAEKVLADEMQSTLFTIAKDVKIQVEFNPAVVSQYRLIGYENRALRNEDFNNDAVDAGDIGAGHQVTAIYEIVPTGAKGWVDPLRYGSKDLRTPAVKGMEMAHVKLRYKTPKGTQSKLIQSVVPASALRSAATPKGDFAFATAVAAYGQKLRGDPMLKGYSFTRINSLAGRQSNFWRQEFIRLNRLAGNLSET